MELLHQEKTQENSMEAFLLLVKSTTDTHTDEEREREETHTQRERPAATLSPRCCFPAYRSKDKFQISKCARALVVHSLAALDMIIAPFTLESVDPR